MKVTSSRMETCFASRWYICITFLLEWGLEFLFLDPVLHMVHEFDGISK